MILEEILKLALVFYSGTAGMVIAIGFKSNLKLHPLLIILGGVFWPISLIVIFLLGRD